MYDYYLDPNAGLYGLRHGSEPVHIMLNPVSAMIMVVNNTFSKIRNLMVDVRSWDASGHHSQYYQQLVDLEPSMVKLCDDIDRAIREARSGNGLFLSMKLVNEAHQTVSENLYWLPDTLGRYPIIEHLPRTTVQATARSEDSGAIRVDLVNKAEGPLAFFIRISLVDPDSKLRLLPVYYSDNYISLIPGTTKTITIECSAGVASENTLVHLEGWNVEGMYIEIEK